MKRQTIRRPTKEVTKAQKLTSELAELEKQVSAKKEEIKNYFTFIQQEQSILNNK